MWFLIMVSVCFYLLETGATRNPSTVVTKLSTTALTTRRVTTSETIMSTTAPGTTIPTTRAPFRTRHITTSETTMSTTAPGTTIPTTRDPFRTTPFTTSETTMSTTAPGTTIPTTRAPFRTTHHFTTSETAISTTAPVTTIPTAASTVTPSTVSEDTVTTGYTATTATTLYVTLLTNIVITSNKASEGKNPSSSTAPLNSSPKENGECLEDLYRCKGGAKCIDYEQVCDGTPDCPGEDDEKLFCDKETTPVVPIAVGVAAVVVLCVIGGGAVFFLNKRRRRSQVRGKDVDSPEHAAEEANPYNNVHDDPSTKPRDSHIYAAINPQDVDVTVRTKKPEGANARHDRHHNKAGGFQAPRDSSYAIPEDLRGTIYENIPDTMPEESPYQALNPDTMENAQYTNLSELYN
ncbi:uncharacterized protein LOC144875518 [Branchiostoma floridae x Branchiostoma japonicum]